MFTHYVFNFVMSQIENYDGNYLEIGVYMGDSISLLASRFEDKKIFAIDPFIEDGNTSWNSGVGTGGQLLTQKQITFEKIKDKDNLVFFECTSKDFYQSLTKEKIDEYNIEIIFIDGDHHYEHVKNDYLLAMDLIGNKKGIVIFDDNHVSDVIQAQKEFVESYRDRIQQILFIPEHNDSTNIPATAFLIKEV